MKDSNAESFKAIMEFEDDQAKNELIPHLITMFKSMKEESPYPINRYEHSLQSATLAYHDGASEELIVAALFHDIADHVTPYNHAEGAATILKPFVSAKTYWIVKHHGVFQGVYFWHHIGRDRNARDKYKDHKWFSDCAYFCEHYDQLAFDPDFENLPLEFFMPIVNRIFTRKPFGEHVGIE